MRKENYSNIVSYVKKEMRTFQEHPFTEVDSLVLTWLVYLHFIKEEAITESDEGIHIHGIFRAEDFDHLMINVWSRQESMDLLVACLASPRFRQLQLLHYLEDTDPEEKKQFAAITFRLAEDMYYICYRGTDWSLVGWEEDFKMALKDPVPSQLQAERYLQHIIGKYGEKQEVRFYVGGHSKGGNLAVYAAAMAPVEVQEKIVAVYSHDGPGFRKNEVESDGFLRIRDRIYKTVPEFSIFGLMFEQEADHKIVHSYERGMMQHNSLFWEIQDGQVVTMEELSSVSTFLRERLNQWLETLDYDSRERFIDIIFDVLRAPGEDSFELLGQDLYKNGKVIMKTIKHMDPELFRFLIECLSGLSATEDIPENDSRLDAIRRKIDKIRKGKGSKAEDKQE